MKKYFIFFVSLIFIFFVNVPIAKASILFSDSFSNGYNTDLWSIPSWGYAPIPSSFGIKYDPYRIGYYSALQHIGTLTGNFIINFDLKINSSPPTDVAVEFRGPDGLWKLIQLYGVGHGGPINNLKAYDSNNPGGALAGWDVSPGTHHFEITMSPEANTPVIVKEDGFPLLTWISTTGFIATGLEISLYGSDSEIANFQLCDGNGCVNPTPTITPTPTPTPEPLPTLPPPPPPIKKVVVIPGFGGSWNGDALVNCKKDDYAGEWTSHLGSDLVYGNILSSINSSGFVAKPFYYDWRKDISETKFELKNFINNLVADDEKVNIVGHSMGGLVGRAYIEQERRESKAERYFSAGTPHKGALTTYPAWSAGKIEGNIFWKIGAAFGIHQCQKLHPELTNREIVREFIPSIQNMLPTFDYIKDAKTGTMIPVTTMNAQNNFLTQDQYPISLHALSIFSLMIFFIAMDLLGGWRG